MIYLYKGEVYVKRIFTLVFCFVMMLTLTACFGDEGTSADSETTSIEAEIEASGITESTECQHVFKESVYKEPGYGFNGANYKSCELCGFGELVEVPALPDVFELTVKSKDVVFDKNGKDCHVIFGLEIKNISDKRIESISGTLSVVSNCILELSGSFDDISLELHSSIHIDSYGYTFDYTATDKDEVERKTCDAEFENMKFSFKPSNVVVSE